MTLRTKNWDSSSAFFSQFSISRSSAEVNSDLFHRAEQHGMTYKIFVFHKAVVVTAHPTGVKVSFMSTRVVSPVCLIFLIMSLSNNGGIVGSSSRRPPQSRRAIQMSGEFIWSQVRYKIIFPNLPAVDLASGWNMGLVIGRLFTCSVFWGRGKSVRNFLPTIRSFVLILSRWNILLHFFNFQVFRRWFGNSH